MNHRICAGLLTVCLLCVLLSSCGIIIPRDPTDTSADTTNPVTRPSDITETTVSEDTETLTAFTTREVRPVVTEDHLPLAEEMLSALPSWDFDGVAVSIVSTDAATIAPDNTDDVVYNARLERNRMVEDKYNTMVMVTPFDATGIYDGLRTALKAGDYYADILALPQSKVGRFAAEGLLLNMMSLPFTDYTADYYNPKALEQLTVGNTLYGISGDFNENLDYLYGLFFNRDMAEQLDSDLYGMVYDGSWDWDAFRRVTKAAAKLDGGAVVGHGSPLDINTYMDVMFASSGVDYFDCKAGSLPSLSYGADKSSSATADKTVRALRSILGSDNTVLSGADGSYTSEDAMAVFCGGDMLFYTERLFFTSWISDMPSNWGILPFPDAGNGYHTFASTDQIVICVPAKSATVEQTGLFLQAANAASYEWLDDVFYQNLEANIIRDSDTLNMLDIITGKKNGEVMYSFAHMFGEQYRTIADATYGALYSAVTENYSMSSYYDTYKAPVEKEIAKKFEIR